MTRLSQFEAAYRVALYRRRPLPYRLSSGIIDRYFELIEK